MKQRLARLFGYMTAEEALHHGFSHHGWYFGIPVWIAPNEGFMVATKWGPMEHVMSVGHVVEQVMRSIVFPDDEPSFQFTLGQPIK